MQSKISYPVSEPDLSGNERKYLVDAFDSGWISSKGKYIEGFETNFANFIGSKYSVSCSNGTTALHLAVKALGIGRDDEVIVPNLTFASPANAVLYEGAKPVLVDIDREYWGIDPNQIESALTSRTKAIIAVHLYGHPCNMGEIMKIARRHDLRVIEDCAEAHGAKYSGQKVGTFGDVSCFSFYGNKIITTGEGGMVLTDKEETAEKMRKLRDHGMLSERRYWHDDVGYNYRMTNLQAAIGVAQIENPEKKIEKRRWIAQKYAEFIDESIVMQPELKWAYNVYWIPTFLLTTCLDRHTRDLVIKKMFEKGIETRPTFFPLSEMPPYASATKFKNSSYVADIGLSLPATNRMYEDDIRFISETLNDISRKLIRTC